MLQILTQIQENNLTGTTRRKERIATVTTPHNETVREPVNESRSSLNKGSVELRISLRGLMSLDNGCFQIWDWGCPKPRLLFANALPVLLLLSSRHIFQKLQIPKVKQEYPKQSFHFSTVKNWNDIPENIGGKESIVRSKTGFRVSIEPTGLKHDPSSVEHIVEVFYSFFFYINC